MILLFVDLFLYAQTNTRRDLNPYGVVEVKSPLVERVRSDSDLFRIHEFNTHPLRSGVFPLLPNQNMLVGLEDIGIYSPFAFADYKKLLGDLGGVDDSLYQNKAVLPSLKKGHEILDRLNVKYLFSNESLRGKEGGFEEMGKEGSVWLYKNQAAWPRVFFTKSISEFPHFDIKEKVEILERQEGRMVFDTQGLESGYLVVSEQNYPGWKVLRGGETSEPIPLATCLKAIPLAEKSGRTELVFEQRHKRILCWVSLAGVVLAFTPILKR